MADISAEIAAFQSAVYGEEVRGSMISAIEKINDVAEDAEDTVDSFSDGFQNAVNSCSSAADSANDAASSANDATSAALAAADEASSAAASASYAASDATAQANAASQLNTTVQQAEAARRTAESARVTAENSRVAAETARAGSESNRNNAEATRQENETNRNSAEVARVSAEATRQANESSRQSAETLRAGAEQSRASAFSAMQQSFSEMEQQVLPPATYSTLGGVIVDANSGLEVASDGTLSFEAGDFETSTHAAATYATIETVNGKANAQHNHSATDINNGTLAVVRGGTGVTTAAAERERLGLGSTTDALPVANGGTGATTATGALANLGAYSATEVDTALTNYLPNSGGTTTGTIVMKADNFDEDGGTPSANVSVQAIEIKDADDTTVSHYEVFHSSGGYIGHNFASVRRGVNGIRTWHQCVMRVDTSGNVSYIIDTPAAFRNALGASSGIWPVSLGGSGQNDASLVTTASQVITAASGITINNAHFAQWGKVGMLWIDFTKTTTTSVPSDGNFANFDIGTIVSGKRPKCSCTFVSTGDGAFLSGSLGANGVMTVGAANPPARTIAANSRFLISTTYVMA